MTQKLKALSSEGGPATGWKNKIRGSILAYTLIVLTIMLMTALSVASVTILDKKNAQSTAGSTQAFANADSGSEILLGYRYRDDQQSLNALATSRDNGSCTNGVVTFGLSGGTVTLTTYSDPEGNSPIDSCAATLATVQKVKSVGSFSGSSRAIEVAVAQEVDIPMCVLTATKYNGNLGGISGADSKCASEFGSGWSFATWEKFSGTAPGQSDTEGWVDTGAPANASCTNWTVSIGGWNGSTVSGREMVGWGWGTGSNSCNTTTQVACCNW